MRREIVALLLLCELSWCKVCCMAQERMDVKREEAVVQLVEYVASRNDGYFDSGDYLQDFLQMFSNLLEKGVPADSVGFALLRECGVLTSAEFDLLLSHHKKFGKASDSAEYMMIPGIDRDKMKLVLPVLIFESDDYSQPVSRIGLIARSIYRHNGLSAYSRCDLSLPEGLSAVFVTESDAGEKVPDYFSWSVQSEMKGVLNSITIGAYRAVAGQGVVLSNAFPVNFSVDPSSFLQAVRRPAKYTSADENRAFRGVAASFDYRSISLNIMGSVRNLDARKSSDGYSSILETGVHITDSELESKDLLQERMVAVDFSFIGDNFDIGTVLCGASYSLPYRGRDSTILKMEDILGQRRANGSFKFRWSKGPLLLFGEAASDLLMSGNVLAGALMRCGNGNEYSARLYYKDHSFVAPLTEFKNSYGTGRISGDIVGKVRLWGDTFLWVKSRLGEEYCNVSLKIRPEYGHDPLEAAFGYSTRGFSSRLDYRRALNDCFSIYLRGDFTLSLLGAGEYSLGYSGHAELLYTPVWNKTSISARITWFDVPCWDNRIYSYERDMLYIFTSRLLYGEGIRWYLNCRSKISNSCDVWLKYAGDMKDGTTGHEFKLQLSFKIPLNGLDFDFFPR